ncbi:M48 family metalloprotease [Nocardia miyunensis]|uniref:M48 family metalloprotease n=1 Tax=Nocardia miyunensis TaxID=282684 RepID=UPI00083484C1|nr:M48 family metalloprotease [Nocardia miyunensis]
MTSAPAANPIEYRFLGAGTTTRFALLLMLISVASIAMTFDIATVFTANDYDCILAAGGDPNQDTSANWTLIDRWDLVDQCAARYQPGPPAWLPLVWTVMVFVAAAGVFFVLPAWKKRRGAMVSLASVDKNKEIHHHLDDLIATTGPAGAPRPRIDFAVAPTAFSTGAVVFGRTTRPIISLHNGLLDVRTSAPQRFSAVVLHELGHVRNRDLTITYLTEALWRAFLVGILMPYIVYYVDYLAFKPAYWRDDTPEAAWRLAVAVLLAVVVYLARADVLRSRELYADLAAKDWGADRSGWPSSSPAVATGWAARAARNIAELWRTHPRMAIRDENLKEPAVLFGVQGLSMVLAGAAAGLGNHMITEFVPGAGYTQSVIPQVVELVEAGMIAGVVGFALCRAVSYAMVIGRPVLSGIRAGLWLGIGLALSELIADDIATARWLPRQPVFLLLMVVAAVVFAVWTTRCALLLARVWPGRTIRPTIPLILVPAAAALASWLMWWDRNGAVLVMGVWTDSAFLRRTFWAPVAGHTGEIWLADRLWAPALNLDDLWLAPTAVTLLWIVPLGVWFARSREATPRWIQILCATADTPAPQPGPPPLRSILRPGLLSGIAGIGAVIAVLAYMHTWRPPTPKVRGGEYDMIYETWLLVSLAFTAALAALTTGARGHRFRVLTALMAAQTASLVTMTGIAVLTWLDGCIPPLTTLASSCRWHPTAMDPLLDLIPAAVIYCAIAAFASVAAVAGADLVRTEILKLPPRSSSARPRPETLSSRRRWVVLLCSAAVGVTAVTGWRQAFGANWKPQALPNPTSVMKVAVAPISSHTRTMQLVAWNLVGGKDLLIRQSRVEREMSKALEPSGDGTQDTDHKMLSACTDLGKIADDADKFFRVPVPAIQTTWQRFTTQAQAGSSDCLRVLHDADPPNKTTPPPAPSAPISPAKSLDEITNAFETFETVLNQMLAMMPPNQRNTPEHH